MGTKHCLVGEVKPAFVSDVRGENIDLGYYSLMPAIKSSMIPGTLKNGEMVKSFENFSLRKG